MLATQGHEFHLQKPCENAECVCTHVTWEALQSSLTRLSS